MSDRIKIADLPVFDAVEYLTNEASIAAYLMVVQEENDPAAMVQALDTVARARILNAAAQRQQ